MIWLAFMLIPLIIALGFLVFGGRHITLKEFMLQNVIQAVFAGICVLTTHYSNMADVEVLNGRVTSKAQERVSCRHSYSCRCYTTCSGGKTRTCTTHCSTCYEHSNDWDWAVYTSLNGRIEIDRVDRRGSDEPPRFSAVRIGEPVSTLHSYENYIKAAPGTLFQRQGLVEKYAGKLPKYPSDIYDYYRLNRTLDLGMGVDTNSWNPAISELNAELGSARQVNIIPVFVKSIDPDYAFALEQHWLGGKKNDAIVIISGTPEKFEWVHIMAWTDSQMFKVKLRDDLMNIGKMDQGAILQAIRANVNELYIRKSFKDFKYLEESIVPTTGQWVTCIILGVLLSVGMGIFFAKNDVFDEEHSKRLF